MAWKETLGFARRKRSTERESGGFGDKWIDYFHGGRPNRVEIRRIEK
jgi:hypothetical protein